MTFKILQRKKFDLITDLQKRVYDGVPFSSEVRWTEWGILEEGIVDGARRLKFWEDLNEYAVSQRGNSALIEYKLECE